MNQTYLSILKLKGKSVLGDFFFLSSLPIFVPLRGS